MAGNNERQLSVIVSSTLITKFLLTFVAFLFLITTVYSIDSFSKNSSLYYISFLLVVGQAVMPTWFFQGMEKMQYLAYVNFFAKVIFTILIFLVISEESDFIFVPLFLSLGNMVSGILALCIMHKKFGIKFIIPAQYSFQKELIKGRYTFLSNFSINAYINSNLLILGFFATPVVVGFYSIADKMVYALRQLLTIFFQASYPHVCKLALKSFSGLKDFFRKYFFPFSLLVLLLCIVCFFSADFITKMVTGHYIPEVRLLLQLISFIPMIICINIPAFQTLLAYNLQKSYMIILVLGSLLNILLNILLANLYSANGTAIALIITEIFITVGLYFILKARHRKYSFI
jgi:PST family polysaccharide transporter